jgi:hypothetical protein
MEYAKYQRSNSPHFILLNNCHAKRTAEEKLPEYHLNLKSKMTEIFSKNTILKVNFDYFWKLRTTINLKKLSLRHKRHCDITKADLHYIDYGGS